MNSFDEYSDRLIENSKFLYLKAVSTKNEIAKQPFLQSSILIAYSALDAYVYSICEELFENGRISIFEKSFLVEKDLSFKNGKFSLSNNLKMTRITDRIEYLFNFFDHKPINKSTHWWTQINDGYKLRNNIVHPKQAKIITEKDVERSILSISECINALFRIIYKRKYPLYAKKLDTRCDYEDHLQ